MKRLEEERLRAGKRRGEEVRAGFIKKEEGVEKAERLRAGKRMGEEVRAGFIKKEEEEAKTKEEEGLGRREGSSNSSRRRSRFQFNRKHLDRYEGVTTAASA